MRTGRAFLYKKESGLWTEGYTFDTSHLDRDDHFGSTVHLSPTHAYVAALQDDGLNNDQEKEGTVYVYNLQ
jgi:hypothetical protein